MIKIKKRGTSVDSVRLNNLLSIEKFLPLGLGFYGRDSKDSEHFKMYHGLGLKPKRPEELKEEYLSLVKDRLNKVGLEFPENVVVDYDMTIK